MSCDLPSSVTPPTASASPTIGFGPGDQVEVAAVNELVSKIVLEIFKVVNACPHEQRMMYGMRMYYIEAAATLLAERSAEYAVLFLDHT